MTCFARLRKGTQTFATHGDGFHPGPHQSLRLRPLIGCSCLALPAAKRSRLCCRPLHRFSCRAHICMQACDLNPLHAEEACSPCAASFISSTMASPDQVALRLTPAP